MSKTEIRTGDCRELMAAMPAASIEAIVTDPPYGLGFMGKKWDSQVPGVEFWTESLRVAKPGAHLLAFGGTRLWHRMAVAIEDAGWEIRDTMMWLYGSGFPKSHNIGKATQAAQWEGWGTALKPAWEPIIVARKKPEGTVAANVLEHGCGGLNVDGCRVGGEAGRWPANLILDQDAGAMLDGQAGESKAKPGRSGKRGGNGFGMFDNAKSAGGNGVWPADPGGGPSRFFYCPKASKADRNSGCEGMEERQTAGGGGLNNTPDDVCGKYGSIKAPAKNHHPTVKPHDLMRYLCRLVTPPGGTILDPFAGSGSTGKAAAAEGFCFIGCELDPEYAEIARARCESGKPQGLYAD